MQIRKKRKQIEILLVEDSPSDALLTREALKESQLPADPHHVNDGVEAMAFLKREGQFADQPRPDLILLDLNLPRKNGIEVLQEIKSSPDLSSIPVVILTTSKAEEDIVKAYQLHVNCYIIKPVDFDQFSAAVRSIEEFWFGLVTLPQTTS